jgi:hypothetical protein
MELRQKEEKYSEKKKKKKKQRNGQYLIRHQALSLKSLM